jgi:hypothetical protein
MSLNGWTFFQGSSAVKFPELPAFTSGASMFAFFLRIAIPAVVIVIVAEEACEEPRAVHPAPEDCC